MITRKQLKSVGISSDKDVYGAAFDTFYFAGARLHFGTPDLSEMNMEDVCQAIYEAGRRSVRNQIRLVLGLGVDNDVAIPDEENDK